jgi:hypothetical protein
MSIQLECNDLHLSIHTILKKYIHKLSVNKIDFNLIDKPFFRAK